MVGISKVFNIIIIFRDGLFCFESNPIFVIILEKHRLMTNF